MTGPTSPWLLNQKADSFNNWQMHLVGLRYFSEYIVMTFGANMPNDQKLSQMITKKNFFMYPELPTLSKIVQNAF